VDRHARARSERGEELDSSLCVRVSRTEEKGVFILLGSGHGDDYGDFGRRQKRKRVHGEQDGRGQERAEAVMGASLRCNWGKDQTEWKRGMAGMTERGRG
jgi:hypothetical protein